MSTIRIIAITLTCDSADCAARIATTEPSVYAARIAAGITGWRYAQGRRRGPGLEGARQFDYCPDCWPNSPHATGVL